MDEVSNVLVAHVGTNVIQFDEVSTSTTPTKTQRQKRARSRAPSRSRSRRMALRDLETDAPDDHPRTPRQWLHLKRTMIDTVASVQMLIH